LKQIQCYLFFCTSFSILFAGKSYLMADPYWEDDDGIIDQIVLSVFLTACVFIVIFQLDKLADSESTGDSADYAIIQVISAAGVSIGLCWEHAFDGAVEVLAGETSSATTIKLVLASSLAASIVPAYRLFICPTIKRLVAVHNASFDARASNSDDPDAARAGHESAGLNAGGGRHGTAGNARASLVDKADDAASALVKDQKRNSKGLALGQPKVEGASVREIELAERSAHEAGII
jgi:hypothetical protein